MTTFHLDPKALEAASIASSTEETRYYLCGVHLTKTADRPNEVCYEATDGHRLIRAWSEPEKDAKPVGELNAIVPTSAVKLILGFARANKQCILLEDSKLVATVADGRIRVTSRDDVVVDTALIDGKFPDTDRVIPTLDPERKVPDAVGFNLNYLADIAKAVKLATGNKLAHASVRLNEPYAPARIEARNFLAVLMPYRV